MKLIYLSGVALAATLVAGVPLPALEGKGALRADEKREAAKALNVVYKATEAHKQMKGKMKHDKARAESLQKQGNQADKNSRKGAREDLKADNKYKIEVLKKAKEASKYQDAVFKKDFAIAKRTDEARPLRDDAKYLPMASMDAEEGSEGTFEGDMGGLTQAQTAGLGGGPDGGFEGTGVSQSNDSTADSEGSSEDDDKNEVNGGGGSSDDDNEPEKEEEDKEEPEEDQGGEEEGGEEPNEQNTPEDEPEEDQTIEDENSNDGGGAPEVPSPGIPGPIG